MTLVEFPAHRYLQGMYAPVDDELDVSDLPVRGHLPEALQGSFLRNGPNPQFAPLGRYHLFDGDGMVHGVELAGGRARYRNRWVRSRGLEAERRAGRALFGGLGEFRLPDPAVMAEAGMMKNTANTNVIRHADRILALMEAAPPTELTTDLETVGEHDFGGRLQGAMTAHPKQDPESGEMLFFGYGPFPPHLRYHVVDATGSLVRSVDVDLPRPVMMHDFVVTQRHVVWFDLPAVFDVEAMLRGEPGITWQPDNGARIGVMPRDATTGDEVRWTEIEPCFVFHFLNGWTDPDGTVVVDGCRSSRLNVAFGDEDVAATGPPTLHRWTIDAATGVVHCEQLDDRPADFPRVADTVAGRRNRYGYVAHASRWERDDIVFDGVVKHDLERCTSATALYGPDVYAGEAVFAADPGGTAEDDGWLLNVVHDLAADESRFVVLDAPSLDEVASVALPRRVPFGFHGNWLPA
jgi:carotenoid cleavage dioxygenase-like enzyme